jgi:hypothetical protein
MIEKLSRFARNDRKLVWEEGIGEVGFLEIPGTKGEAVAHTAGDELVAVAAPGEEEGGGRKSSLLAPRGPSLLREG